MTTQSDRPSGRSRRAETDTYQSRTRPIALTTLMQSGQPFRGPDLSAAADLVAGS